MCEYFSCIVTRKGEIFWCEDNSHEETIKRAGLKDDKLKKRDFVRIEVRDGDMKNWRVDEEATLPDWYKPSEKFFKTKTAKILKSVNPAREQYNKIENPAREQILFWNSITRLKILLGNNKIENPAREQYNKIVNSALEQYKKKILHVVGYVPKDKGVVKNGR